MSPHIRPPVLYMKIIVFVTLVLKIFQEAFLHGIVDENANFPAMPLSAVS